MPPHASAKARSVSGSPNRASSAARNAAPSKPDGSGYFFTACRCTNSRLQAWIGSSAWVSRASARFRLDAEQGGDEAVQMRAERHDEVALVLGGERRRCGAGRQQARVQCGILGREPIEEDTVQPHQPLARRRGRRS